MGEKGPLLGLKVHRVQRVKPIGEKKIIYFPKDVLYIIYFLF